MWVRNAGGALIPLAGSRIVTGGYREGGDETPRVPSRPVRRDGEPGGPRRLHRGGAGRARTRPPAAAAPFTRRIDDRQSIDFHEPGGSRPSAPELGRHRNVLSESVGRLLITYALRCG